MVAGAQIKISKDGIEFIGQTITHKASQHLFQGGESVNVQLPALPNINLPARYSVQLDAYNHLAALTPLASYTALLADGRQLKGVLDERGVSDRIYSDHADQTKILVGASTPEWGSVMGVESNHQEES